MKKAGIVIGMIVVIVAAVIVTVLVSNKSSSPSVSSSNTSKTSSSTQAVATITYSDDGFSPALTTVKSGDVVAIKNIASATLDLDSDPHPVHTDDTDLNVGDVEPGQTKTFTVTKKGSFGFHNHLASGDTGKIVVQ